jgi:hypothetical protein
MRILIHDIHHAVGPARFMAAALRRLGHDVRTIGDARGENIWGIKVDPKYTWQPAGGPQTYWTDWRPDMILVMSLGLYHHAYYHDVPHVLYIVDNHVVNIRQPGIAHYFLGHKHGQAMPAIGDDVTWLSCAYDPTLCTPSPIPWAQRRYDVGLIGVLYPRRVELINKLVQQGFVVAAGMGVLYNEFREFYHNSRISLCLSLKGDVAMRIFETAAMGCLVLSDPCTDFPDLAAQGIVLFASPEEAVESVRRLLAQPLLAQDLIEKSMRWVAPHTWDARGQTICDWFCNRFGIPAGQS